MITSTNEITSIAFDHDGSVWVGTHGGVLHRGADHVWHMTNVLDGLGGNEIVHLGVQADAVVAQCPQGEYKWDGARWSVTAGDQMPSLSHEIVCSINSGRVVASPADVTLTEKSTVRSLGFPPSTGSHITALIGKGNWFLASVYGDSHLWEWRDVGWKQSGIRLPNSLSDITALAEDSDGEIWIGTRRQGTWAQVQNVWTRQDPISGPKNGDIEALCAYRGAIYASTLEDGLLVNRGGIWSAVEQSQLSSVAPRQMVVFRGTLYVLFGSGHIDSYDGTRWKRDALGPLPRKQASSIAADTDGLVVGQWGGWSEWDGTHWTSHFSDIRMQSGPVLAIAVFGKTLWFGTQRSGLAEADRESGTIKWHGSADGISDDWVKCVAVTPDRQVLVGTFVRGPFVQSNGGWHGSKQLAGDDVTDITSDKTGRVWISTVRGVFYHDGDWAEDWKPLSELFPPAQRKVIDRAVADSQALGWSGDTLDVGTRTGLLEVSYVR